MSKFEILGESDEEIGLKNRSKSPSKSGQKIPQDIETIEAQLVRKSSNLHKSSKSGSIIQLKVEIDDEIKEEEFEEDEEDEDDDSMTLSSSSSDVDEDDEEEEDELNVLVPRELKGVSSKASYDLFSSQNSRTLLYLRSRSHVTVFESIALFAILEEFSLQLDILGHAFQGHFVPSDESDFLTYDERFVREVKERELEYLPTLKNFKNPFKVDESKLGTHHERLAQKLQKDRAFLSVIVNYAKDEMRDERSFEKLKELVKRESNRRSEEITLSQRKDEARTAVKRLTHKINEFKGQIQRDEMARFEMLNELHEQLHAEKLKCGMDERYARAWFSAQNRFTYENLKNDAQLAKLRVQMAEQEMKRDRMAHKNLESWHGLKCNEIRTEIKSWDAKFEADIESIDKRIRAKNEEIKGQEETINTLNEIIADRMIELGPYEEEKERQKLERDHNLRLYYTARKIQRWWRAYMRRHNLYKKKKGKGGKGKKGKKGRKGKK